MSVGGPWDNDGLHHITVGPCRSADDAKWNIDEVMYIISKSYPSHVTAQQLHDIGRKIMEWSLDPCHSVLTTAPNSEN